MISHHNLLEELNVIVRHQSSADDLAAALQHAIWRNSMAGEGIDIHHIKPHARTIPWSGMDSKIRYENYLADPTHRQLLAQYGWIDTPIKYHINSWGFRSEREYDNVAEPCIVALGCSFTYGTGLHAVDTWPHVLASMLGVGVVNLGMAGHGLDLNSLWLRLKGDGIANPIGVCVVEPPAGRISWMKHIGDTVLGHTLKEVSDRIPDILADLLLNSTMHYYKNYLLINEWANNRNIPLLWSNTRLYTEPGVNVSSARDLGHWGVEWHRVKAEEFYNHLKNT